MAFRYAVTQLTKFVHLKGLGHEIEFKYFDKKLIVLVLNSYLSWFLNFQNTLLMRLQ
jgi:hypothetical protein